MLARWRYHQFRKQFLPLSQRRYWTPQDLRTSPPDVDCVVCGSDQVWNVASFRGFDPAFFLDFVDDVHIRRVSYAATFGYADDLGTHRQAIAGLLSKFQRLSVRDVKSQQMVRELTGCQAEHVLDPCFLTEYGPITAPRIVSEPYIVVYCPGNSDLIRYGVRAAGRALKMPIVSIGMPFEEAHVIWSAGPRQWLSLMCHADFVCTNSFHGVCFSIINRKNFVALPIQRGLTRIEDVLKTLGLSDRLICSEEEVEQRIERPISYDLVDPRLEGACRRSHAFLHGSLIESADSCQ